MKSISNKLACACALMLGITATSVFSSENATKKVLEVGADLNYPPYDYYLDGKPSGFDPSLLKLLAEEIGAELKFSDTRFASLILGLKSNRYDVAAAGMYITPERAQQIDFLPYMKTGVSLVVLKGNSLQPQTPSDLCGLRTSSVQGSAWIPKLAEFSKSECVGKNKPPIGLFEFPSSAEAVQSLFAKSADVMVEDVAVAAVAVKNTAGRIEVSSKEIIYPVVSGYGVRKDNPELLKTLSEALDRVKATGKYAELLKEYNLSEPTAEEISTAFGK